jgi:DnaD/phage-associated family protein
MEKQGITIEQAELRKLLAAASGDAALLFLHIQNGGDLANGETVLQMTKSRIECAAATLRQLGLWQEERKIIPLGERPAYSESDVLSAMNKDGNFRLLYGEIQRLLGRAMNTEELKILLSFDRYLGLPCEVISLLVSYCKERARSHGKLRNPSLRTIEKEAYAWAEQGIDTLEDAAAFIQNQNVRRSRLHRLMDLLQIRGRALTPAEEKYATAWLEMGFSEEVLSMAYERTCLNTGGLSWAYMNKILARWQEAGLYTLEQVKSGEKKPVPKGASGQMGEAELAAIQKLLQEG